MTTVTVQHTVADFDAWKSAYDEHESARRQHGCTSSSVCRVLDTDTVDVLVVLDFPDAGAAGAFLSDPSLKEAMANAGVQGPPQITVADEVESIAYAGASA